jgi:ribonuclease HI
MDMKYCPAKFKKSITVALRKPGKDDYSQPKSYRPIALMNTIGKILDTVLARRIQYYAERHHMLPTTHTGGRKQSSCEHAIHLLLEKVHSAWRRRNVASLLMLDVSGAFDNVSHERLLHNMRKRGLPLEIINWTASYLTGRKTKIKLYEGMSTEFDVPTGIPQGSPLSPILYLFYNADLLEIARGSDLVTGYIDDTSFLVEGLTTEDTARQLEVLHAKADEWAQRHASVFAPAKYELIHFIYKGDRKRFRDKDRAVDRGPRDGVERVVEPKQHARYLGVILDSELNGMKHMEHVKERVEKSIQALGSIAGSTWGATRADMLTLVKAIIMPQMLFACSTWWISNPVQGRKTHQKKMIQTLNALQKKALCVATGAFKSTAAAVIEAETNTLPIDVQLDRTCMITANRIKASPLYNHILRIRERGSIPDNMARLSPLQELEAKVQRVVGSTAHNKIEKQVPIVAEPWWIPPNIRIAPDADTAVKEHDEVCQLERYTHMKVYTDGSDIQGRVGAAAWEPHRRWKCAADIGPSDQFTVYGAELIGIWMALDMGVKGGDIVKRLTIFTDNQASIISSARPRNQSGQLILKKIHWLASVLRKRGCIVTIRWIPAHIGVLGNEMADILAKQATGWRDKKDRGPTLDARAIMKMEWLPQLLSSCKRLINSFARECWTRNWRNGETGMLYKKRYGIDNGNGMVLDRHVNKIYNSLSHKAEASVLIQMRTEKIGLHGYLHKINRADDPWCGCEQAYQTVRHIIEDCECLEDTRFTFLGTSYVRDARVFLRDSELIPKTVRFILATGLLDQFAKFAKTLSPL